MSRLADAVVAALSVQGANATDGFGPVTVDVPRDCWAEALGAAYTAGATFFDLLTAYDLDGDGLAVMVHVATDDARDHVLLRARVPRDEATVATATTVYRGAAWHERETHEMFGIDFVGNERLDPLLLPAGFGTAPLRKDVVLAARAAREWPGHKDPSDAAGRPRRRTLPPGVPADWPAAGTGDER
ncbi:MAG TPA: NADH-quinone oxidoreductase subunit C [Candidatus Angelobacter sp.]|nr:NADH-quinone oxidoreductase subunit C [Candidatus Angelobacter sp.]